MDKAARRKVILWALWFSPQIFSTQKRSISYNLPIRRMDNQLITGRTSADKLPILKIISGHDREKWRQAWPTAISSNKTNNPLSSSQAILNLLRNLTVHHRIHNSKPVAPLLNHINSVHKLQPALFESNFNNILSSIPASSTW